MKTHYKSLVNFFIFAPVAIVLWASINPILGQTQNLQLQEIKQTRERDTITIAARLFGDFKFDAEEASSNVFFTMHDGRVIPLGFQSGNFSAEEIASVYIYRPDRKKDLVIEISVLPENESKDTHPADDQSERLPFEPGSNKIIYVLDGEIVDYKLISILSPQRIKMVNVLKGEAAVEKYKDKMKDKEGVIEIETHQVKFEKLSPE